MTDTGLTVDPALAKRLIFVLLVDTPYLTHLLEEIQQRLRPGPASGLVDRPWKMRLLAATGAVLAVVVAVSPLLSQVLGDSTVMVTEIRGLIDIALTALTAGFTWWGSHLLHRRQKQLQRS